MKTKNLLQLAAVWMLASVLMGCPYNNDLPLSTTGIKVPDALLGIWEVSGENGNKVKITKTSETTMAIEKTDGYDGTVSNYEGHITLVGGVMFINVKETGDYATYYFYKIEKDGEYKTTIYPVTTYIREQFASSEELKAFFDKNMVNSYFYTTDQETYYKIK